MTSARPSHTDDVRDRQRRYVLTQLLRLACFVVAVLPFLPMPVRLALIALGMLLPLMGVVAANAAGPVVVRSSASALPPVTRSELPSIPSSRVVDQEP